MTTVDFEPLSLAVPLREEPAGVFRVGKSRVLLELVIRAFQRGETPEGIVQSYDTLSLPDVYAVVGYYLAKPRSKRPSRRGMTYANASWHAPGEGIAARLTAYGQKETGWFSSP